MLDRLKNNRISAFAIIILLLIIIVLLFIPARKGNQYDLYGETKKEKEPTSEKVKTNGYYDITYNGDVTSDDGSVLYKQGTVVKNRFLFKNNQLDEEAVYTPAKFENTEFGEIAANTTLYLKAGNTYTVNFENLDDTQMVLLILEQKGNKRNSIVNQYDKGSEQIKYTPNTDSLLTVEYREATSSSNGLENPINSIEILEM